MKIRIFGAVLGLALVSGLSIGSNLAFAAKNNGSTSLWCHCCAPLVGICAPQNGACACGSCTTCGPDTSVSKAHPHMSVPPTKTTGQKVPGKLLRFPKAH